MAQWKCRKGIKVGSIYKKLCHRSGTAMCQSKPCQLLHNSVGTTCTTNPEQIEVMNLEGYSQPTYANSATTRSKLPWCDPQAGSLARPSTRFVDHTNTPSPCCVETFLSPRVQDTKFQREVPLFLEIPKFPYDTVCGTYI